jgi:hypothetical protein
MWSIDMHSNLPWITVTTSKLIGNIYAHAKKNIKKMHYRTLRVEIANYQPPTTHPYALKVK